MNVLLGVSGSVAATLTQKMKVELALAGHSIKTVVTQSALQFKEDNDAWGDFYTDYDEWKIYSKEHKVLHIDLVNWSDVLVIAPCTANTLSKIHAGISDNLLTCCVRAWDYKKKLIIAPSMNTAMYINPPTAKQIREMSEHGIKFVSPVEKKLFCGVTGIGAMAQIEDIINSI